MITIHVINITVPGFQMTESIQLSHTYQTIHILGKYHLNTQFLLFSASSLAMLKT